MRARGRVAFSFFPLALSLFLLASTGCRSTSDLVEAELRTRENDLRILQADVTRLQCQNEALVRELQGMHQESSAKITPELASQTYTLKQISLGRGTGGLDEDNCPGDEALMVVLEPRDCDGHTIKAPGQLHVEASEISPEGLKTLLSTWDVPPDQLRRAWRSGFLSTGYFVVLPWKTWPGSTKLRVVARFTLADGRMFEADKDVTVHLTPPDRRRSIPPVTTEPAIPLPMPKPVDPSDGPISRMGWTGQPINGAVAASTSAWRPKPAPSLADAVHLSTPIALP
jgi:hypothetical protein